MYSDEIIKQELTRYSVIDKPVTDDEVARWKASFVSTDNEKIKESLEYTAGRSYFWSRLMQSIDMPQESTVDEVMTQIEALRVFQPQFEIGIQVAMRMLDKQIKVVRIESDSNDYARIADKPEPKKKGKEKSKTKVLNE